MKHDRGSSGAVARLLTAAAVRDRSNAVLRAGLEGALEHFAVDTDRIQPTAVFVADTVRQAYPGLDVPGHSRWRHFAAGGIDRWGSLASGLSGKSGAEIARIQFDLVVTSTLLDAGAGGVWQFSEPETEIGGGGIFRRSEGLAVASFHHFREGGFSADPADPLRADAEALAFVDRENLAAAFQASGSNPLVGLEGRAALMRRLGEAMRERPDLFGTERPRIGNLYDCLARLAPAGVLPAESVLATVLDAFGPIWPGRIELEGVNLGDTWRHPAVQAEDVTDGLVPFHKLSQWLTYSLIEPLERAGIAVIEQDGLTGLPEYRNGGLLIDMEVLRPKSPEVTQERHDVGSTLVVEWRALTVALLDRVVDAVRQELNVGAVDFPLAKVLEGGTWSAGRRIAAERRPDSAPPIEVRSDGTVF